MEPDRLVSRVAWRRVWHAAKFLSHSPLRAEVKQVVKNLKTAGKCGDEPRRTVQKLRNRMVLNAGGCRVEERARDRRRGNGGLVPSRYVPLHMPTNCKVGRLESTPGSLPAVAASTPRGPTIERKCWVAAHTAAPPTGRLRRLMLKEAIQRSCKAFSCERTAHTKECPAPVAHLRRFAAWVGRLGDCRQVQI